VFLIVLWRLRMKLSLRDLAEILLLRGLAFSHEAVRDWEAKLAPRLSDALRQRRRGKEPVPDDGRSMSRESQPCAICSPSPDNDTARQG